MRNLVFDHSSNPASDRPIYKLSAARAEEMVTSGQAFRLDSRRIQKFVPPDMSQEELAELGRESKTALTFDDMQANVGIGGQAQQPCPRSLIRRAQARIRGWNDGRAHSHSVNSGREPQLSVPVANSVLALP